MTVKKIMKAFTEKYPAEAISTLTDLSCDLSLTMSKFDGITLMEGTDKFTEFMEGYVAYKKDDSTDKEVRTNDSIMEQTKTFIKTELFHESKIPYSEAASFVENYISHMMKLQTLEEKLTAELTESSLSPEDIGMVPNIIDAYIECLTESVTPVIDKLLWASGYSSRQQLAATRPKASMVNNYFL